jgi:hypothetical protein
MTTVPKHEAGASAVTRAIACQPRDRAVIGDPFLSAREVAEALGVSRATAYRLMREMVHFRRGKLLRVSGGLSTLYSEA